MIASNYASTGCFRKEVIFRLPGLPEVVFYGERRRAPSGVTPPLLLDVYFKGCNEYLAHVNDTRSSGVRFEVVPVVRDFLDVFLTIFQVRLQDEK